jgi:DNA-binding NarL/FixJ family response regulator
MLVLEGRSSPHATEDRPHSQPTDRTLRVLVVDDHPAIRTGLSQLLEEQPDMTVLDAVPSAEAAMAVAEFESPDVVVADYQLGSRNGLWLSRKLKQLRPPPAVVIYTAYCDGPLAAACVVAEADGLVSKGRSAAELCHVLRAAARGTKTLPPVPPAIADAMRRRLESQDQAIFGLTLAGVSRAEVAKTLRLSRADLDSRMWAMLHALERLRPAPDRAGAGRGARFPRRRR